MMRLLIPLLASVLLLAACKSAAPAGKEPASVPTTGTTHSLKADEAAAVVKKAESRQATKEWLTAKVKATVGAGEKSLTVSGALRMRRDDVVQLSLFVPVLGMEALRLEFTPQDVLVLDRVNKEYVRATYDEVSFLREASLDFYSLQALFRNELFVPGKRGVAGSESLFSVEQSGDAFSLTPNNTPQLRYAFRASAKGNIEELLVTPKKENGTEFRWTYGNFQPFDGKAFPMDMLMTLKGVKRPVSLKLVFSSLKEASDWQTRTTVSKKYERRTAEEVLSKYGL
ncbi:MAG: DUF4292 domain-containing protein [Alloprevotella sp.]